VHGLASYILNTLTPQRNGRRGEYGQSDGYFGKTVNRSEGVLELCEKLDK
jgi:hypothetical protein